MYIIHYLVLFEPYLQNEDTKNTLLLYREEMRNTFYMRTIQHQQNLEELKLELNNKTGNSNILEDWNKDDHLKFVQLEQIYSKKKKSELYEILKLQFPKTPIDKIISHDKIYMAYYYYDTKIKDVNIKWNREIVLLLYIKVEFIKSVKEGIENLLKENEIKIQQEKEKEIFLQKQKEKHEELSLLKEEYNKKEQIRKEEEYRKRQEEEMDKRIKESKQILHNIIQKNKLDQYKAVKVCFNKK